MIATLDPSEFRSIYPEFIDLPDLVIENIFQYAELIIENTGSSIVTDDKKRKLFLYLLSAHIAFLNGRLSDDPGMAGMAGTITSSTQGTTSVGMNIGTLTGSNSWLSQTRYGTMLWKMLRPYVSLMYYG